MTRSRRAGDWWLGAAALALLLALWYLGAWLLERGDDPLATSKLPYPHLIVERLIDDHGTILEAAWLSISQALLGFAVGTVVAIVLSVAMAQAGWLESALMPYVLAAQMVPMISLVPIAQNVFQSDTVTRLFISGFITFFSVTIALVRGLKSAPPSAYELMASYDTGRVGRLRYLEFPAAVPMLFSGLRIAAPLSLVGAVLVDLMGAQTGLGYLMLTALTFGPAQATLLWAAMVVTLLLGLLMSHAVVGAECLIAPWQPHLRGAER